MRESTDGRIESRAVKQHVHRSRYGHVPISPPLDDLASVGLRCAAAAYVQSTRSHLAWTRGCVCAAEAESSLGLARFGHGRRTSFFSIRESLTMRTSSAAEPGGSACCYWNGYGTHATTRLKDPPWTSKLNKGPDLPRALVAISS